MEDTKSNNYILYQAYGKEDIINEAIFSILTILSHSRGKDCNFNIIVYTDKPDLFRAHLNGLSIISYRQINDEELKLWRGEIDFVHRVKIKIIQDFFANHTGNLLYCDSDTYFTSGPSVFFPLIKEGKLLMHINEGRIDSKKNSIFRKIYSFLKNNVFTLPNGKTLKIPLGTEMWNAGVLGLNASHAPILEDVLQLTDIMYARYNKHIMEQLAFSYFFQTNQAITATDNIIYHYWDFKEFRAMINEFLAANKDKNIEEKAALILNMHPKKFQPEQKKKVGFLGRLFGVR